VPLRLFKGFEAEGGIRAPLIVSGPGVRHEGGLNHSVLHVMDMTPTFLELAGVEHPAKKEGSRPRRRRESRCGRCWPVGEARSARTRNWLGWELFGNRAIRQGDWKLLYLLKGAGALVTGSCSTCRATPAR